MRPFQPSSPGPLQGFFLRLRAGRWCDLPVPRAQAAFRVLGFISYNLGGGYVGMNRQELIIMLTVLAVGVCIIVLILLNEL